jgi:calcium-dependent protein kinase
VSSECKDLIKHLLVVDPKKRYSAEQAIKAAWFKKKENEFSAKTSAQFDEDMIQRLKTYRGESLFKRAAMNMLVKMANNKEVQHLKVQFE